MSTSLSSIPVCCNLELSPKFVEYVDKERFGSLLLQKSSSLSAQSHQVNVALAQSSMCLFSFIIERGAGQALTSMKRLTSGSSSPWRVCVDKFEEQDGRIFAQHFRDIEAHEKGKELTRTTSGLFFLHALAEKIAQREDDYSTRTSPLLIDIVLPRFMERDAWIQLSHDTGYGVNSHLVWENARFFKEDSPRVELANGGNKLAYYHYGSDDEYLKPLASARHDGLRRCHSTMAAA